MPTVETPLSSRSDFDNKRESGSHGLKARIADVDVDQASDEDDEWDV